MKMTLLACGFVLSFSVAAQTFQNMGSFNAAGVPEYLDPADEPISLTLLANLNIILPDGENLQEKNPALYNKSMTAITLAESSDVYLAFVSEGADFQSTVGFYTFQGTPPSHPAQLNTLKIVFPNVSGVNSGGGLKSGNRVKLGNFPAGTSIGFFLISNSFKYGRVMNAGNDVFYTDPRYNPEFNDAQKKHAVMLFDQESKRFVLLFEDFNRSRGSDHDFNDAVFLVSATSKTALSTAGATDVQKEKEIKEGNDPEEKQITICHYPPGNTGNPQTITIPEVAWATHKTHGDQLGECVPKETAPDKPSEPQFDGDWNLIGRNQINTVQTVAGGMNAKSNKSPKWFLYKRIDAKIFKDNKGNVYQFNSDTEGEWRSASGKVKIKLVKIVIPKVVEEKKIVICHFPPGNTDNPQQIEIAESAWPAHQAHGDTKGECKAADTPSSPEEKKIMICHYPPGNTDNPQQIEIAESAWPAHQAHGDTKGECKSETSPAPEEKKIMICHYPPGNTNNPQQIEITESAWQAHEAHGDTKGECKEKETPSPTEKMITICHYPPGKKSNPQTLEIPESAWKAHETHGDSLGKCN